MPLVSIVIPTYSAPELLLETLDTVLAQTFTDYEVVIVNDGSPDDTAELIAAYAAKRADRIGGRLRVITQKNEGIGAARNRGIAEARGKYVALLDHDDLWMPGKLAAQVAFMKDHPRCAACVTPWARSTSPDECAFNMSIVDQDGVVCDPLRELERGSAFITSSALMFDRDKAAGLKYETLRQCIEDVPFQIGLLGRGDFGVAGHEILMVYREHQASYSKHAAFYHNGVRMLRRLDREGRFSEFTGPRRDSLKKYIARIGRTAFVHDLTAGKRREAVQIYLGEFGHQLRIGRLRFLAVSPLLIGIPTTLLRRRWGQFTTR